MACLCSRMGLKVLALDADPNANLSYNLGLKAEEADQIIPISENWSLIEEKTGVPPNSYGGVFRLSFTVDDIITRYAVGTPCGVNLLVMGVVRSASSGCMCPANALVRSLLRYIMVKMDEVIVADMEAGTEHLGRGTAEHVDYMLTVVEPTSKALKTAQRIKDLALELSVKNILLVGNKV
ncbi:MAG: cobyrinic acid a,c-diamide synthase, partial [Candidatus Bathyarchaeia archaeon]